MYVSRARSRCRKTDFFGDNAGKRNITPNAFTYAPPAFPSENSRRAMTATSQYGNMREQFDSICSDDKSEISALTISTQNTNSRRLRSSKKLTRLDTSIPQEISAKLPKIHSPIKRPINF